MSTEAPVVYVVDDDLSVRQALSSFVRSTGLLVQTFASAEEFRRHPRADAPSCVILDVMLPDVSGLELLRELASGDAAIPIVCITGHGTIPMGVRAIKEGALEFLTKPFREEDLLHAIEQALDRDRAIRTARAEIGALKARIERLTPREREVMALIVTGRLNKQIAAELGTAEQTIKQHRGRVMQKLEVDSVAELVRLVARATRGAPDAMADAAEAGRPPIVPS